MIWIVVAGFFAILFGLSVLFGAPYVPSQRRYVRRAFQHLYQLGEKDTLVDLGSGDGVVLRIARETGATAVGYEIHPLLVLIARWLCRNDTGITIHQANFWRTSWPDSVTVVYMFGVMRDGRKLVKRMQRETNRLERPLTLICHGNPLPNITAKEKYEAYFLYVFSPTMISER